MKKSPKTAKEMSERCGISEADLIRSESSTKCPMRKGELERQEVLY